MAEPPERIEFSRPSGGGFSLRVNPSHTTEPMVDVWIGFPERDLMLDRCFQANREQVTELHAWLGQWLEATKPPPWFIEWESGVARVFLRYDDWVPFLVAHIGRDGRLWIHHAVLRMESVASEVVGDAIRALEAAYVASKEDA